MYSDRPPSQFDRPLQHPRDHYHPTPPSREQRPIKPSQNHQSDNKNTVRGAVPFNRVQLAAALIEYNDTPNHNEASGINWELQEISHQPVTPLKQAPYSAIFIPFRHTLPPKQPDFFSGLELVSSPKSYPQSFSGFGLVSDSGIPKLAETITVEQKRFSQNVVIENAEKEDHRNRLVDDELEVLSEWGLDKVLSGNLTNSTSASVHHPQDANHPQTAQPNSSRAPKHLSERKEVKSDMFDFHFSELRLHEDPDNSLGKTATGLDFLAERLKPGDLNTTIDDEALLRQRVGCDPEGRKFLRPQSVMELKKTQLLYQNSRARLASTSKTKQMALARSRAPTLTSQRTVLEDRIKDLSSRDKGKSALRAQSLSPTRLVPPASAVPNTISHRTHQRSSSGILQISKDLITSSIPVRTRRKSALDEPSTNRLNLKLPHASQSLSGPTSPKSQPQILNADPKPKRRTSADIAERYQKSIALLEGRRSEDMVYDVPNQHGSSLGGSQLGHEGEVSTRDKDSVMLTRVGSTSNSQSEFSLAVPTQFTSRFDPKVASVLSQVTPSGMSQPDDLNDEQADDQSFDSRDEANVPDENSKQIYDEHGRIRFPASLKPMVLIMPIPLTPAQPESDQVIEDDVSVLGPEEVDPLEKAKQEQIQKLKQVRPAGKLYGRSLIDELNSRTATQKSRRTAFGANRNTKMFLSPQDASRPGSIYPTEDEVPEMQLRVPNNANSRLHLANQAVRTTQYKFNQALVNSSKARQSVFGMDMVMKAELDKLKKIKAIEEKELQEEEMKIDARQAKKQARKRGKSKNNLAQESNEMEEVKDRINNRLTRIDNWDAILERESQPLDLESRYSAALAVPETRYFTPLPVLPAPTDSHPNLVSNMDDWFKDKLTESSDNHTPMINSSMGHDDDNEYENANTLARKLELQVENMKYKPLANVFESHHMVRPESVQSHAAFLSAGTSTNTPNALMTSTRVLSIEENPDQEEVLNMTPAKNSRGFSDPSLPQTHGKDDDNSPLSQRRNYDFLKYKLETEDDNRPLSMFGAKLAPTSVRSLARSNLSARDSDEELPLGIRASILLSQKHPPIDLTNDAGSFDGPIGSDASDESDLVPLGIRATILQPFSSQTFQPSAFQSYSNFQRPVAISSRFIPTSPDDAPGNSPQIKSDRIPNQAGSHEIDHESSARFVGGQSNDIPLNKQPPQSPQVSPFNPAFSFSNLHPAFNNPFQAQLNSLSNDTQAPIFASNSDDDDVPIGRRMTLAPFPLKTGLQDKLLGIDKQSTKEINKARVMTGTESSGSSENGIEATRNMEAHIHQARQPAKFRSPIASQIIVDESVAREDTLAALEGRGNLEQHADDDVPLGVTRAAHSVTVNGTIQRERTRKKKIERERKQEANKAKAKAEWESLTNEAQRQGPVQNTDLDQTTATDVDNDNDNESEEDDDDVPLGMSHHASMLNPQAPNRNQDDSDNDDLPLGMQHQSMHTNLGAQMIQRQLMEQQNHGFGVQHVNPMFTAQQQHEFGNPIGHNPGSFMHHMNPISHFNYNSNISFPHTNLQSNSLLPLSNGQNDPFHQSNLTLNHHSSLLFDSNPSAQSDSNISKWRQDVSE